MSNWEYKIISWDKEGPGILARLGQDGWEAVGFVTYQPMMISGSNPNRTAPQLLVKRPMEAAA